MKIKQVRFQAFGQFINQTFTFKAGLNVIPSPNESGKSTLLQGIYALLYGAAQEGLRVRREADWYAAYRPWLSEQYGGHLDYQLGDDLYRLVRNLQKGREQEQLFNLHTGEELQYTFLLDQRRERKIAETQLGIAGELYRRVAYLSSYIPSGSFNKKQEQVLQQKLMYKLSTLLEQGDEFELTAIIRQLDLQIEEIGKTEQSKQKPLGILTHRQKQLSDVIQSEKKLRDDGLQAQVELQELLQKKEKVERQYQTVVEQHQRMSLVLQGDLDWYRYEKLQQSFDKWKTLYKEQLKIGGKLEELEITKQRIEPLFRMQLEDVEECNDLYKQQQSLIHRIKVIEEQQANLMQMQQQETAWWKPIFHKLTWSLLALSGVLFMFSSSSIYLWLGAVAIFSWVLPMAYSKTMIDKAKREKKWKLHTETEPLANYQQLKDKFDTQLAWWTKRVGTHDVITIRTWWKQTQAVEQIEWEIEQLERAKQVINLEEGDCLQKQLTESLRKMSYRYQGNCCFQDDKALDMNLLEQRREELQTEIQQLSRHIGEKTKQVEELEDRIRSLSELCVEWEKVSNELEGLLREKEAIEIAKEMLQAAYCRRREDISPVLQQMSSKWIKQVTANHYDCLYTDVTDNVSLSLRIPETGRIEKVDQLSTGTLMQMIFALKMAIVQYISTRTSISLPILLDDCFVYYDDDRLSYVLPLLVELAKSHQILLCTCHTREQEMLHQLGHPYHLVSLKK